MAKVLGKFTVGFSLVNTYIIPKQENKTVMALIIIKPDFMTFTWTVWDTLCFLEICIEQHVQDTYKIHTGDNMCKTINPLPCYLSEKHSMFGNQYVWVKNNLMVYQSGSEVYILLQAFKL